MAPYWSRWYSDEDYDEEQAMLFEGPDGSFEYKTKSWFAANGFEPYRGPSPSSEDNSLGNTPPFSNAGSACEASSPNFLRLVATTLSRLPCDVYRPNMHYRILRKGKNPAAEEARQDGDKNEKKRPGEMSSEERARARSAQKVLSRGPSYVCKLDVAHAKVDTHASRPAMVPPAHLGFNVAK